MELDKHSAWKSNDVKSRQPPSDKNAVLVNGHKPIVNPLYDDDEFDVDTETPFLTALATADVPKQNQIADGGKEYNNQTVEDGEILDNSNEEAAVNDRKTHRNAAKSSKNNDKSRRASKSRSGKSNNHSPERRLSSSRFRERSSSCGDRDKERRPKTADAEKARESMNRDKRDTKRYLTFLNYYCGYRVIARHPVCGFACIYFNNNNFIHLQGQNKRPPRQSKS